MLIFWQYETRCLLQQGRFTGNCLATVEGDFLGRHFGIYIRVNSDVMRARPHWPPRFFARFFKIGTLRPCLQGVGDPGLVGYLGFFCFVSPRSVKTKETNPTSPGSLTPCKQALRSNDAYGNENNKQNNNFARASRFFSFYCTFLCPLCTTTTWKCLILRFMEYVTSQRRNFISLSALGYGP